MALNAVELAAAHDRIMAGEYVKDVADDLGISRVALYKQHRRRYGNLPEAVKDGGCHRRAVDPAVAARVDQAVAGMKNWRRDPRGMDAIDSILTRIARTGL